MPATRQIKPRPPQTCAVIVCLLAAAAACGSGESSTDAPSAGTGAGGAGGAGGDPAGGAGESGAAGEGAAAGAGTAGSGGTAGAAPIVPDPTLASLQATFFTPSCATNLCHSAKQKAGGISMASEAESCAALVNAKATETGPLGLNACAKGAAAKTGMLRVKPGSPDESFLYLKISSPDKCVTVNGALAGDRMPKGKPAAAAATVEAVAQWIASGAACQ